MQRRAGKIGFHPHTGKTQVRLPAMQKDNAREITGVNRVRTDNRLFTVNDHGILMIKATYEIST